MAVKKKKTIFDKMKELSEWRFGLYHVAKGFGGVMLAILYGFLNIFWYIALGILWVLAILAFVIIIIPGKMMSSQYKKRTKKIDVDIYATKKRPKQ